MNLNIAELNLLNKDDFRKIVNPAVNSAKGNLLMLNEANIPEAKEFYERMHFTTEYYGEKNELQKILTKSLSITQAIRYYSINYYAERLGAFTIVDLGCGFSPRGLHFKKNTKIDYIGIDLPAVINDLRIAGNDMNYVAADMTNLNSLEKALKNVSGRILIITEGVLNYFTESELKAVFQNIKYFMDKNAGIWITTDFINNDYLAAVMEPLIGKDNYEKVKNYFNYSGKAAIGTEIRESNPAVLTNGLSLAKSMGFVPRELDFIIGNTAGDFMKNLQPEYKAMIIENFKKFKMTLLSSGNSDDILSYGSIGKSENFSFNLTSTETDMTIHLKGRLDTISSPELLSFYENAIKNKKEDKKLYLDCSNLEYVSSAGLRVFLMLYKGRNQNVELINWNQVVDEILEQTGFKEFLCK